MSDERIDTLNRAIRRLRWGQLGTILCGGGLLLIFIHAHGNRWVDVGALVVMVGWYILEELDQAHRRDLYREQDERWRWRT